MGFVLVSISCEADDTERDLAAYLSVFYAEAVHQLYGNAITYNMFLQFFKPT